MEKIWNNNINFNKRVVLKPGFYIFQEKRSGNT